MAAVEQVLWVVLLYGGVLCLLVSVLVLFVGFRNKAPKLKKRGYGIGLVSLVCFGLLSVYYFIVFPATRKSEVELFSGTYVLTETSRQLLSENTSFEAHPQLILHQDGRYEFDGVEGINLAKRGTWKIEEENGAWGFYDEHGQLHVSVAPATNGIKATFAFEYRTKKDNWKGTRNILFEKKR